MFAIFEPKTFDTARSDEPSRADLILTISSGADVAKETTVIPISILAILNFKEIETADFNSKFPPNMSNANPKKITLKKYLYPSQNKFVKIVFVLYIVFK